MAPTIQVLPVEAADDGDAVRAVTDLVNRVYAVAEDGQWLPGTARTSVGDVTEMVRSGQIVVARHGADLVGVIRVQRLDARTAETGMLAVDPGRRSTGIGRELRRFVVEQLRDQGITTLQIELLVPRHWVQASKTFMAEWNSRAGYEVVGIGAFEDQYAALAPRLATPCDFIIYRKQL